MVAVRGLGDGGVVVAEVFPYEERRPVGQNDVVFGEAFFHGRGRRYHHHAAGAEVEQQNVAVFTRQVVECSVEGVFDEMEVADDWE